MKRFSLLLLAGAFLLAGLGPARAQSENEWFPPEELMRAGSYYYPEHWPEAQWNRDLKRMAEMGFEFTHFAEFSWARLEPREGQYNFEWLDKAIRLADRHGLQVILCTPTPTPPAWLTQKHPDIRLVNKDGRRLQHGGRLHTQYNHPTYRHYAEKIIRKLAERYGNDERVIGWQIDNEPHYNSTYDYSPFAREQFQQWLRNKYGPIDSLNQAWGTHFWSQTYNHYDQIQIPNKDLNMGNPHQHTDFKRFTAEEIARFLRWSADLLEQHISERQWVTTNFAYFKFLPMVDPMRSRGDMDFTSHTMYLTSGWLDDAGDSLAPRLGSGMELAFSSELARSVEGYTGIMELQPGQINWGRINAQPLPGAVRMWLYHVFGLSDRFVCNYRFRQPTFGGEQYHAGMMRTDGTTLSRGGQEYKTFLEELQTLRQKAKPRTKEPESYAGRRTAFLWKMDNLMNLESAKHSTRWDTWQHYYTYYQNLKSLGCPVDFVTENQAWDPQQYPFLVAPAHTMVTKNLVEKWKNYAQEGGHLVLSVRTARKDTNGWLWEARQQAPIWDLIGARILFNDQLDPAHAATAQMQGQSYDWHLWGEKLEPMTEVPYGQPSETWAHYADQFYEGAAGVVHRKVGKGSVTYVGIASSDRKLERAVLQRLMQEKKAEPLDLPPYVFVEWRPGDYWVAVNYSAQSTEAPIPEGAKTFIGDSKLEPGDVAVWRE